MIQATFCERWPVFFLFYDAVLPRNNSFSRKNAPIHTKVRITNAMGGWCSAISMEAAPPKYPFTKKNPIRQVLGMRKATAQTTSNNPRAQRGKWGIKPMAVRPCTTGSAAMNLAVALANNTNPGSQFKAK